MIFNQDGWLTEQTSRNPDGWDERTVSDYSDSQKLLTTKRYDSSGSLVDEVRYIYEGEERLVAEQHVSRDGKVTTPIIYACDTGGLKVKVQKLDYNEDANLMIGIEDAISAITRMMRNGLRPATTKRDKAVEVNVFNTAGSLVSKIEIIRDARGKPIQVTLPR